MYILTKNITNKQWVGPDSIPCAITVNNISMDLNDPQKYPLSSKSAFLRVMPSY